MDTWLEIEEFCRVTNLSRERVEEMAKEGTLRSKTQEGKTLIEASIGANAVISKVETSVISAASAPLDTTFVEKTIGTILSLHEKVLEAKDESIGSLKGENQFLKEALFSMQDVYDEDKKTIQALREQLKIAQEEIEFMRRKYKLMWGKVADLSPKGAGEGKE